MRRGNSGLVIARQMPQGRAGVLSPWDIAQANSYVNPVKNSVRLRSGASLSRTWGVTGNNTKFTLSWFGRRNSNSGGSVYLGNVYGITYASFNVWNFTGDRLVIQSGQYGISNDFTWFTQGVFTDTTHFHHFQIAVDTSQSVAWKRFIMYYDGNICPFDGAVGSGAGFYMNTPNPNTFFGSDMEVAEAHLIDGQQLTPAAFQTNDGRNLPIKYTGTYGTCGWHMEFADTSALTSGSNAGIGKDTSGNGNYLNTNNISITAGSTYDAFTDTPVDVNSRVSTFATLDPRAPAATTLSNGNLTASGTTDLPTIIPTKGNWYFEIDGVSKTWTPPASFPSAAGSYNFGQRPLTNAIPAGHALLNSFNVQMLGA